MKFHTACLFALLLAYALPLQAQDQMPTTGVGSNYETRLSALEDALRQMNGQLEQLNFAIRRLDQNAQRSQSDNEMRLGKLESTLSALTMAQQQAQQPVQVIQAPQPVAPSVTQIPQPTQQQPAATPAAPPVSVDGTLGAIKTQDGRIVGTINNPQSPPLPDTPPDYGLTVQEQYDRAFALLRQANYEQAEKAFENFIDKNPKDKLAAPAKYWHAETLYVRGRFLDAAAGFADAYQQEPQGPKAPDSLLKLGLSLAGVNKTAEACTALAEVGVKFPKANSTIRSRALEERQKLKCGAA